MKSKFFRYWWIILISILLLGVSFFFIWALTPLGPEPEAVAAMQSDDQVTVTDKPWLIFQPVNKNPISGFIFYPGGRVDPVSYAPLARDIAENGYLAVIAPMPLNLAVFDPNRAAEIIDAYPQISNWVISGHSLGGAMAANFVFKNPDAVDGLAFLAAYPASSNDLSSIDISVLSIFGSNDGIADPATINNSRPLLPDQTIWKEIIGGNHAQFGWYGEQPGDNPAQISHDEQQAITTNTILELISNIENK